MAAARLVNRIRPLLNRREGKPVTKPTNINTDGMVNVEKHIFNYLVSRRYEDLHAIGFFDHCYTAVDGKDLYVCGPNLEENEAMWDGFFEMYKQIQEIVFVENIVMTPELRGRNFVNSLQTKFGCICIARDDENKSIDVICTEGDIPGIREYTDTFGKQFDNSDFVIVDGSECGESGAEAENVKHPQRLGSVPNSQMTENLTQNGTLPNKITSETDTTNRQVTEMALTSPGTTLNANSSGLAVGYDVGGVYKVFLHMTDITRLRVDAIVNSANGALSHGSGIARAINNAAGPELQSECQTFIKNQKKVGLSKVVRTTAGDLPCKMVLHVVGPKWPLIHTSSKDKECIDALERTFYNVLKAAEIEEAHSVAIPPISSGVYRVPHHHVADTMFSAILEKSRYGRRTEKHIHLVDINDDILKMAAEKFKNWKDTSVKISCLSPTDVANELKNVKS